MTNTVAYIDEIQPTMRRLVTWLQGMGFKTCDSGDGVLNVEAGMEGALDYPHVFMTVDPAKMLEEAHRLHRACATAGLWDADIEVCYKPSDGLAILMLTEVTDASFGA